MESEKFDLPENAKKGIIDLAIRFGLNKVILFGSRARGDNSPRSDIDIAITGGNTTEFIGSVDDNIDTLLMFDVVDLDGIVQKELLEIIEREGILIYEKV